MVFVNRQFRSSIYNSHSYRDIYKCKVITLQLIATHNERYFPDVTCRCFPPSTMYPVRFINYLRTPWLVVVWLMERMGPGRGLFFKQSNRLRNNCLVAMYINKNNRIDNNQLQVLILFWLFMLCDSLVGRLISEELGFIRWDWGDLSFVPCNRASEAWFVRVSKRKHMQMIEYGEL